MKQIKLEVRSKNLIQVDGLDFKDLNGNGKLDPYEDWRLSSKERAEDLVSQMNLDEKVGMMMITTQTMGKSLTDKSKTSHDGILNEEYKENKSNIFVAQKEYGNSRTIKELNMRHFILRENYSEVDIANWINAMNEVAEGTRLGIPVLIASNSRNENAERTFGMNDAVGVFSTWPGTLGLAAATLGDIKNGGNAQVISEFAEYARREWTASGIRKGYMYMLDTATDPRWQRIYGTFGEDTDFISEVAKRLILGFQGEVLDENSVALTMKHFPGGGARENGFDPHYEEGKFNVYSTPGSLEKYHLPPFQVASDYKVSSFMPYYSIPSEEKSAVQTYNGKEIPFEDVGFAFNKYFIDDLLRKQMGFEGYINSDSGILDNMDWGVEDLAKEDKATKTINAGVDIIADTNEVQWIKKAVMDGKITEDRIDESNIRLLIEMFDLGLFDSKTYVDPEEARKVVTDQESWDKAYEAHQKSVVLLKNKDVFPLKESTKVYVEGLHKEVEMAKQYEDEVKAILKDYNGLELVDQIEDADIALVIIYPKSGNYFSATPGLLELGLCENKLNTAIDGSEYKETTVSNIDRVGEIEKAIHNNGGKLIISVNTVMPWLFDSIEPLADGLVAHFETLIEAQLDVFTGKASPSGVLPITLPASADVIAVDEDGQSISRNDVPGYDKDLYMPQGMHYAYIDETGNEYKLGFGLNYRSFMN